MSTVQDETDTGPDKSDVETESAQYGKNNNNTSTGDLRDAEQSLSIAELLEDVRQQKQREGDFRSNGKSTRTYGDTLDEDEEESSSVVNGKVLDSPGKERPSSADGSLSTPDDTPSIQVSVCE